MLTSPARSMVSLSALHRRPWNWRKVEEASLARYVNPACVSEAISALNPDGEETVRDLLDDGKRLTVAELLYQQIAAEEIDYDLEGYLPDTEAVQRIRTPLDIVERKRATCLDLALLYAGAALNEGLQPWVIVLDGHALTAVVDTDFEIPLPEPSDDLAALTSWIEQGSIVPIECTGMTNGESLDYDFANARHEGTEVIQRRALDFFFDPKQLHQAGRIEPLSCHRTSVPRLVVTVLAVLAVLGGSLWWLSRPGPPVMEAAGGANLAVFPLVVYNSDGSTNTSETHGVGMADLVARELRGEFSGRGELQTPNQPGWEVWGPTQLAAEHDDGFALDDDLGSELAKRNIDVAVYGEVEEGDQTYTDINIWFQPSQRASLGGLSGPIEVRRDEDGSNGSVNHVAGLLAEELDGWFTMLSGLGLIQDAESIEDLEQARNRFKRAAEIGAKASVSSNGSRLEALAETMIGSTHLLMDSTLRADAFEARSANLGLANRAFNSAIALAPNDDDVLARSYLGLAQAALITSGCEPDDHDPSMLDLASRQVDQSNERAETKLGGEGTIDPGERWFKSNLVQAWIDWCRWSAGLSDGSQSLARLSAIITNFESRDKPHERARTERLAAQAYGLRALLTGAAGPLNNPEASLDDALRAQCLSPQLLTSFLRDELRGGLQERYPEIPKESCRD